VAPPLVVTIEELDEMLESLDAALTEVEAAS
jgi:acetylornithine/succinyldiaminopimelate/putrescine aminotransferase